MLIYDRWGVLINRITPPSTGWNGKDLREKDVVEGVYYYIVTVTDENYQDRSRSGFVHLFR